MVVAEPGTTDVGYNVDLVRQDFPVLGRRLAADHPLVYLDSANTSQKPGVVLDAMDEHYRRYNANVARAMHQLGAESSAAFEGARDKVAAFINAPSRDEVEQAYRAQADSTRAAAARSFDRTGPA